MAEWNEEFSRGMVVTAHPDDAEFGCSGTVAKWCAAGWGGGVCTLHRREQGYERPVADIGGPCENPTARADRRRQGTRSEGCGVPRPSGCLSTAHAGGPKADRRRDPAAQAGRAHHDVPDEESRRRVGVRAPGPHGGGRGGDGGGVSQPPRDHLTFPELLEEGLEPHNVREVWVMGHPSPDIWIDVTDSIDTSIEALLAHTSQLSSTDEEITASMKRGRRERAKGKGMKYAESFKRISFDGRGAGRRVSDDAGRGGRAVGRCWVLGS